MMKRLALLVLFVVALLAPRGARADEPKSITSSIVASAEPPDVAVTIPSSALALPELPADMTVEEHGWLRIAYPKGTESRVEKSIAEADELKQSFADALGQDVLERVEVRVARSPQAMAELAPASLPPPAWAVGITYPPLRLVLVSLVEPTSHEGTDVPETIRHELAHMALHDATLGRHMPLWFQEGVAIHFSGEKSIDRMNQLWQASMSKSLIPLSEIDTSYPRDRYDVNVAYAESADFVRFLLRDPDRARFQALVTRVHDGEAFDRALGDAYGSDLRRLEFEWREGLAKRFTIWPALTGGSLLWVLGVGLLVLAYVRRRRRAKATLERWAREEAIEDALALADEAPLADAALAKSKVTIEHEGRIYTLH